MEYVVTLRYVCVSMKEGLLILEIKGLLLSAVYITEICINTMQLCSVDREIAVKLSHMIHPRLHLHKVEENETSNDDDVDYVAVDSGLVSLWRTPAIAKH